MKKCNNYWTKEKCNEISLKYKTRSEFRKNDASAYRTSIANNWLNNICSHMSFIYNSWNYYKCKNEALKYTNRSDFQKNSGSAYAYATKNKILNDICSHMIKIGNLEHRCIYVFEFEDNHAYIGLTYNISAREFDHKRKGPVFKYIEETKSEYKLIQLTDYIKKEDAQKIEESTILEYKNIGWILLNTKKESTLGGSTIYWTYEKCKDEASKYMHKNDFRKGSGGAFYSAIRKGWYEEICSHMTFNKPERFWEDEELSFLMKNYNKGVKYCSKELNKSYFSVKSQYQVQKKKI